MRISIVFSPRSSISAQAVYVYMKHLEAELNGQIATVAQSPDLHHDEGISMLASSHSTTDAPLFQALRCKCPKQPSPMRQTQMLTRNGRAYVGGKFGYAIDLLHAVQLLHTNTARTHLLPCMCVVEKGLPIKHRETESLKRLQ